MEVVAKDYFRELVNRYFFQETTPDSNEYVIHDLMHDVSEFVTKDECFRIESETTGRKISTDIRHLSIYNEKLTMDKLEIRKCKKLCTLRILNNNISGFDPINSWLNELTNICSLFLTSSEIMILPESIGNLKHLRYLVISGTKIEQLPNSFCNLYKLECLVMRDCKHFQCFPEYSNRLISMKLVTLPEQLSEYYDHMTKVSLVAHIPNLVNAIHLDELKFAVTKEKGNTIGTLKHINGIYNKMQIYQLDNVCTKEEAGQAQLNNKKFVKILWLSWFEIFSNDSVDNDHEAVLEGLCPHPNLRELFIKNYRGENLHPSWLKAETLTNLTTIGIEYCINITIIPCLPRSVTNFLVRSCKRVKSLQNCLVPNNLPSLKRIEIWDCKDLVSMAVETFHEFTYLQDLFLSHCPKLTCQREIIALPPSLQHLYLASCGELEERFSSSLGNLTSLTHLTIRNCPCVTSIPLDNLKSLEKLEIWNCGQLRSIGGQNLLASVKFICINSCPKLEETNGKKLYRDEDGEVFEE